jgi:hypothetical protein
MTSIILSNIISNHAQKLDACAQVHCECYGQLVQSAPAKWCRALIFVWMGNLSLLSVHLLLMLGQTYYSYNHMVLDFSVQGGSISIKFVLESLQDKVVAQR